MTVSIVHLVVGVVASGLIGVLGYRRGALSVTGVVGAILVGTLIFGLGGWIWGLLLVVFFVSSSWLSHYREADKTEATVVFAKGGRRDLGQALANGGAGAVLAVVFACRPDPLIFAAFLGVMATVNADTWATELGVLSRSWPRVVMTGEVVPPGTSGAVSRLGIGASIAGALLIGTVAVLLVQLQSLVQGGDLEPAAVTYPLLAVAGGVAGSLFDSLLGATVQATYYCDHCAKPTESARHRCGHPTRKVRGWRWLTNDLVNLTASLVGGLVAVALAQVVALM
ncbi:MAG: DUF92 domain-containing protein [Anaerolineae bacterium]|nr:DUF92 domain-containing protein [Anaerolineae bacterium]